jgi:integrase
LVTSKFPAVELVYPKEQQAEPFRTYAQIEEIIARGGLDERRIRELWDSLFLDPKQIQEVLEIVRTKTYASWLFPFLVTAAYTGARRSELFRSRREDFDFQFGAIHLREKKRKKAKQTFRTVDMTPFVAKVMTDYFNRVHPGGEWSFCVEANAPVTIRSRRPSPQRASTAGSSTP